MKKLTPGKVDKYIKAIQECEKRTLLYGQLYDLLAGWESDISSEDEAQLNLEIEIGDIKNLSGLGQRFSELADSEYHKAQKHLKEIKYSL